MSLSKKWISGGRNLVMQSTPKKYEVIDLAIALDFDQSVQAFGVSKPTRKAFAHGGFVGSVARGGSCNCDEVVMIPHCHATHTETVGHVLTDGPTADGLNIDPYMSATLVTIQPNKEGAITNQALPKASTISSQALILRTLPNGVAKKSMKYNDQAPYLTARAMESIVEMGIDHLLVDMPSVDPINDGGELAAHRIFWNLSQHQSEMNDHVWLEKTITELIYVPNEVEDGIYGLNLQVMSMKLDAAPSRPLLLTERTL